MALSPGHYRRRLRSFLRLRWWALRQTAARFEDVMFTRTVYLQPKMMVLSLMGGLSMLLYYPVWKYLFPQPYENLPLRVAAALLLLPLACLRHWPRRLLPLLPGYWYAALTFVLPFFIGYMTLRNGASAPWLMTHLAALFLGMMLVDLASFALVFGVGTLAAVAAYLLGSHGPLPLAALAHYLPLLLFALFGGPAASLSQHIAEQNRVGALTDASNNIAHELRTPLGSLRIAGQAVRRFLPQLLESHRRAAAAGLPVPELRQAHLGALEKSLDVIDHEVTHANTVIDMLLLAARPIGQSRFELVHALAIVRQALERYPYASRSERERVSLAAAGDFVLLGAETLLVHVVFNLLRNALFHTGRAGKGQIELQVEADAKEGRIRVYDTGPGIPPEVLPRIFNRFYSFSDSGQGAGGLGIGLSFSQAAVRSMGGEIRCRSRWGEFTEFVVAFPVAPGAMDP